MTRSLSFRRALLGASALGLAALAGSVPASAAAQMASAPLAKPDAPTAKLEKVMSFDRQVTGVAVSEDGRVFVNFPRWYEDSPVSVAEIKGGKLVPYPDAEWNSYRDADPKDPGTHFVCVQAETADGHGHLWVIDPAAPATGFIVPGGPKLVEIDLKTDKVINSYRFGGDVAPQGSYLNDIRVSADGRWVYMTDSGAQGALVVLDTESGKARRVLDGATSTQVDKSVAVVVNGKELRRADGSGVQFAADSISLDPKGEYVYFQPVTAKALYRIPTAALQDASLTPDQMSAKVETVSASEPNDGLWQDKSGKLYFTAVQKNAVETQEPGAKERHTLVKDPRLVWPDTFAEGPNAELYVTNSAISNEPQFNPKGWTERTFNLWKIVPAKKGEIAGNPAFDK
ncbi:major royal jelly family protein [Lichenibacterium dinghuense]|uniref:major royal jelly family protein n=1 Tax=Lichenibacterium dinghuense TaxID=2895977 RepID=UPI001F225D6C|nr:major royal jelly family protein [Lichenibacterium sp. 6Y81]